MKKILAFNNKSHRQICMEKNVKLSDSFKTSFIKFGSKFSKFSILNFLGFVAFVLASAAFATVIMQKSDIELIRTELRESMKKSHLADIEEKLNTLIEKNAYQEAQIQDIINKNQKEIEKFNANIKNLNLAVGKQNQIIKNLLSDSKHNKLRENLNVTNHKTNDIKNDKENVNWQMHVVKQGDTFAKISKEYGVTIRDLEKENPNLNTNNLKIGSNVRIP